MKHPVFICGQPRSGTTLLLALLDSHPELVVFPEETWFRRISRLQFESRKECVNYLFSQTMVRALDPLYRPLEKERMGGLGIVNYEGFDFISLKENTLNSFLISNGTAPELLECLMNSFSELTGQSHKRYYIEKSPLNEHRLHQFFKWWPHAKAIYVVRDPRAVFLSLATRIRKQNELGEGGKANLSIEEFIVGWGSSLLAWFKQSSNNENCILIHYIDLVQNRELIMRKLSAFLEINFDPVLLSPTKMGKPWLGNSSLGNMVNEFHTTLGARWRIELSDSQVRTIETYLGKAMVFLGYKLSLPRASLKDFPFLWVRQTRMKWQLLKMIIRLYSPFQISKHSLP